jgi:RNA polymerase sigma-70 factor (ECF subfamily)
MAKRPAKSTHDQLFEKEMLPHIRSLQTFAYHLTYNQDDADDLVQETYMKAYRFIDKYETGTNAKAWLFKILKNAYINEYRKKVRQPSRVDFEDVVTFHESEADQHTGYSDLQEEIFLHMMGDEVTVAINSLPEDFRTVILLCDIEGFTYEEMAVILEVPIGTVRSRLFRARNLLKEKLMKYAAEHGYVDVRGQKQQRRKSRKNLSGDNEEEE